MANYMTNIGILKVSIKSKNNDYTFISLKFANKPEETKQLTTDFFETFKTLDNYIRESFNIIYKID